TRLPSASRPISIATSSSTTTSRPRSSSCAITPTRCAPTSCARAGPDRRRPRRRNASPRHNAPRPTRSKALTGPGRPTLKSDVHRPHRGRGGNTMSIASPTYAPPIRRRVDAVTQDYELIDAATARFDAGDFLAAVHKVFEHVVPDHAIDLAQAPATFVQGS